MRRVTDSFASAWGRIGPELLPFADVATSELPLGRLLRLSLFQVSVGMAVVLLTGTLNRVMIVELGVPATMVALVLALPLVFAPLRALIGFSSDNYRSALGWRRVPFIWFGTLLQFGGLAIMPFALFVLSGDTHGPVIYGQIGAAAAFLLVGAGLHTTQTAGLALATDIARPDLRPRVVALLFVMLLVGMLLSSLVFGGLLADFSQVRLIRVVQGAAVVTLAVNVFALWKQEARNPERPEPLEKERFRDVFGALVSDRRTKRLLIAVGLGTAAFAMQDALLEPYGGEVLGLSVAATTQLTALLAGGMLLAFAVAARRLGNGMDPHRLAAYGVLLGIAGFTTIAFVAMVGSPEPFAVGVLLIGVGSGLFAVATLAAAMELSGAQNSGLTLGVWGAVQATAAGAAIALGGAIRDVVSQQALSGSFGSVLNTPVTGYAVVYNVEIVLLFTTLIVIGPLAAFVGKNPDERTQHFGLAEFPN